MFFHETLLSGLPCCILQNPWCYWKVFFLRLVPFHFAMHVLPLWASVWALMLYFTIHEVLVAGFCLAGVFYCILQCTFFLFRLLSGLPCCILRSTLYYWNLSLWLVPCIFPCMLCLSRLLSELSCSILQSTWCYLRASVRQVRCILF